MSLSLSTVSVRTLVVGFSSLVMSVASAHGAIISTFDVGVGSNAASIQIDQEDGDGYIFNVRWDALYYTSWDAMIDIDAALDSVSITYQTFSWGYFLTGVTIDGDTNYGVGDQWPIENYWHFWVRDTGSWMQAQFGANDRILTNGLSDAWVFGSSTPPQIVPVPGVMALTLLSLVTYRARRRSDHMKASRAH